MITQSLQQIPIELEKINASLQLEWFERPAIVAGLGVVVGFLLSTLARIAERKLDERQTMRFAELGRSDSIRLQFSQLFTRAEQQLRSINSGEYSQNFANDLGWSAIKGNMIQHQAPKKLYEETDTLISKIDQRLKMPHALADQEVKGIKDSMNAFINQCQAVATKSPQELLKQMKNM